MQKEVFQPLFGLLYVCIQPVVQVCAVQKAPQQSYIAVMGSVAAPGEQGIDTRCQRSNEQETAKIAVGKGSE